ncbi:MAG: DNA methyltransferase [Dermatophilaceae bacterium]
MDPPYNTGERLGSTRMTSPSRAPRLPRTVGPVAWTSLGSHLVANTEANGRFHSDWLSMMYPRLKLARNLLNESGVLIVAIDDGEHAGLRQLLDQVFGTQNFLSRRCLAG